MKCVISCNRPLRNTFEILTLKEGKIFLDDGRYERLLLDDEEEVEELYYQLYDIIFSWKQEYIGDRVYDGEKYLIELDVNHKKKKYKIQNKYPNNWEQFLKIKEKIMSYDTY